MVTRVLLLALWLGRTGALLKDALPPRVVSILRWRVENGLFPLSGSVMTYAPPVNSRLPEAIRDLRLGDVWDEPGGIPDYSSPERAQARVVLGLLYLAAGGLDEAHAVAQAATGKDSTYLHALLHRAEGEAPGEMGLTGWANARYWFGVMDNYHPVFEQVAVEAKRLAAGDPQLEAWFRQDATQVKD